MSYKTPLWKLKVQSLSFHTSLFLKINQKNLYTAWEWHEEWCFQLSHGKFHLSPVRTESVHTQIMWKLQPRNCSHTGATSLAPSSLWNQVNGSFSFVFSLLLSSLLYICGLSPIPSEDLVWMMFKPTRTFPQPSDHLGWPWKTAAVHHVKLGKAQNHLCKTGELRKIQCSNRGFGIPESWLPLLKIFWKFN